MKKKIKERFRIAWWCWIDILPRCASDIVRKNPKWHKKWNECGNVNVGEICDFKSDCMD